MKFNEFVNEAPRVAAEKPEIVSAHDDGKTITIKVRGHDGAVRTISNSNPAVLQQQLNLKYGLRLPHSIAKKFAGMPAAMVEDQADNPDSWQSQAADQQRDAETVRMADQDAEAGGLAEEQLDEKSVSKAQFRTMAAAAHNPKFARKVGISSDVAQEFHGADKKSNYKSLPRKVSESKHTTKVMITETRTYKLWESAGRKLMEAQLTADQITQIFQQVEQGATAAGGNRTLIGQGKDAAEAVNRAWEDLKTKVQNSGPIKGVDAMYDQAAEKLKQATGGDQGVMKYVEKYRAFAKAHPVAQSLIYAALIAAAGITGVAPGGAAVLGLFKLVDKLLQGEKFSSAAYSGAKTGAMAYGAAKVGDLIRGAPQGAPDAGAIAPDAAAATDAANNINVNALQDLASDPNLSPVAQKLAADLAAGKDISGAGEYLRKAMDGAARKASMMGDMPDGSANAGMRQFMSLQNLMKAADGHPALMKESVDLTESQIFLMIGKIVERQRKLDEGIMDTLKGAAGKAVDWAKTKGTNLTTKITADKLLQAWKKAGSPTDSLDVAKVIQSAGVPSASIKQVYGTMKIPFAGEPGAGATPAQATSTAQAAPLAPAAKPAAPVPTAKPVVGGVPAVPATPAPAAQAPAVPPAAKPTAPAGGTMPAQGFNATNVMKMPGMEKYAKPAATPAAKTANFGGGPTGYGKTTTTIKPATAKPAAVAAEDASWGMAPEGRGYRK
jgi:hypothetical protein